MYSLPMPVPIGDVTYFYTAEAANQIGRSKDTLLRVIRQKKIADVKERDCHGNRLWSPEEIDNYTLFFNLNSRNRKQKNLFQEK